jgi:transposase
MVHVGIDLHQKSSYLYALDDMTGELLLNEEVASERQALLDCLVPCCQGRGAVRLVLEACGFAGYWSDVLDPLGEVVAVHPKHVKGFQGKDKKKNDRRDAQFLVDLSRINRLPRAYLGSAAERDLKDLLRYRVGLVRIQTRLRVRLRNVAQRYGRPLAASDVDSAKGRQLWAQWELRDTHRLIVDQLLAVLAEVGERVVAVEEQIAKQAVKNPAVELLDSLPGVGPFGALLIAAEIGEWKRFPSGEALACFAGLVPSEASSGGRTQRGRITKEGSSYLRWIMVQAALHADQSPRLNHLYARVRERRGPLKARVAVAREMLVIAWHMLRTGRPYEERPPQQSGKGSGQLASPLTP